MYSCPDWPCPSCRDRGSLVADGCREPRRWSKREFELAAKDPSRKMVRRRIWQRVKVLSKA